MARASKRRIDKLEAEIRAAFSIPNLPSDLTYEGELARWDRICAPLEAALDDAEAFEDVAEFVMMEFWRDVMLASSTQIDVPPDGRQAAIKRLPVARRAPVVVRHFLLSIHDVQLRRVAAKSLPLANTPQCSEDGYDPLNSWARSWVWDLIHLDCRLPKNIDPAVMARIADLFANHKGLILGQDVVCGVCGFQRPLHAAGGDYSTWTLVGTPGQRKSYRHPTLFGEWDELCPACGDADHMWSDSPKHDPAVWQALAEQELAQIAEEALR